MAHATSPMGSKKDDTTELLDNPSQSDILFKFPDDDDGITYYGHKSILCRFSSVFDRMFNGADWKEASNGSSVEIEDIEPDEFYELLRFIYRGQVILNDKNLMGVCYAAHKYDIELLETRCANHLGGLLYLGNATYWLEVAYQHRSSLVEKCLRYIDKNIDKLIENESVFFVSEEALIEILCRDSLCCNEFKLFKFALEWSERAARRCQDDLAIQSRKRKYSAIFQQIRFLAMNLNEFLQCFAFVPDFFEGGETHAILKYFTTSEKDDNLAYSTVVRTWNSLMLRIKPLAERFYK